MGIEMSVQSEEAGKRASKRARVLLAARLRTPKGEIDVRLRDLSAKGALIECKAALAVGSAVVFIRGGIEVPARVAWAGAGRAGLQFDAEIDADELLVRLGKGLPSDDPYRYRHIPDRLTVRQRRLAQAWGATVGLGAPPGGGGTRR